MSAAHAPSPRAPTARDLQKAATRAVIVDAAVTLLSVDHPDDVTNRDIAVEAGFTIGAIYASFEGKGDLVDAAIEASPVVRARVLAAALDRVQQCMDHEPAGQWRLERDPNRTFRVVIGDGDRQQICTDPRLSAAAGLAIGRHAQAAAAKADAA